MTAPETGGPAGDANAKGIAVIVVAVVIGVILLAKIGGGSGGGGTDVAAGTGGTTTTVATTTTAPPRTTPPGSDTTTTTAGGSQTTRAPAQVKVAVLNGASGKVGLAGANVTKLKGKGYTTQEPGSANAVDSSVVYYATGYQADAVGVATALGLSASAAQPLPADGPSGGTNWEGANVVVVLGQDAPAT